MQNADTGQILDDRRANCGMALAAMCSCMLILKPWHSQSSKPVADLDWLRERARVVMVNELSMGGRL